MKETLKKYARPFVWCAFGLYLFALVIILFIVPRGAKNSSFELYLRYSTNFIPFKTILGYLRKAIANPRWIGLAVLNILGNLALFFPMGAVLPCLFKRIDKWWKILPLMIAIVLCAEGTQMLLRIGIFDIDDFILNIPGAMIGYGLTRLKPINKLLRDVGIILDNE